MSARCTARSSSSERRKCLATPYMPDWFSSTSKGVKTRRFEHILSELEQAFDLHDECGSYLGGVHFEVTGEDVTECIGGARGLTEEDLQRAYRTQVDPRLNYEQALEMALRIARRMGNAKTFRVVRPRQAAL